jgi:predicted GH43/DUF377 family glycosyl hydrolase
MFYWEKLGKVFTPQEVTGRPWLKEFAQAPAALIFDDFVRVYFSCRPSPDVNGQYVSYTAYVDLERSDLTKIRSVAEKPILSLGDLGTFDEFGIYPFTVIRDGDIVRAYYGGWTRCESTPYTVAIGIAVSHDNGRTFVRLGPGPVISQTADEAFVLSGPKIRRFNDRWQLFYVAGTRWVMHDGRAESIYRVRLAESTDGLLWERSGRDLLNVRLEADECQACPDVTFSAGRYHMFYCYKYGVNFRNSARGYRIGYAHSENLRNWIRQDDLAGISVSKEGWDSESIAYPHLLELDGETYMLYLGNGVGREGFGIARLIGQLA